MAEPKVGDRISIDAKKVGQPRRGGVVRGVTQGISGARFEIEWDDGSSSIIAPRAGVLLVERPGKKASKKSAAAKPAKKGSSKNGKARR
jgi:hypothetical protein